MVYGSATASLAWSAAVLALGLLAGWLLNNLRQSRLRRARRSPFPIPTVPLTDVDPAFAVNELGPTLAAEVTFLGRGSLEVVGGTTDTEAWVLAVLAKGIQQFFEFGTCTGKTAYLVARNAPPNARIHTLTLGPDQLASYVNAAGDTRLSRKHALKESKFEAFLYTGTAVESKIHQLFGDSKEFDESPYLDACDLVFVDGSHAYSYVVSDSAKALRMVRPGGLVIWHDYNGEAEPGVFHAVNELARDHVIRHIAGTEMAVYRRGE